MRLSQGAEMNDIPPSHRGCSPRPVRRTLAFHLAVVALCALSAMEVAHAQEQEEAAGPLTDPTLFSQFNGLERQAALANQAVYNALFDRCSGQQPEACTGEIANVFRNAQELVETAEEILTGTDRRFGLNLDTEGLGFALRWTAAEELLAQGSMANDFANSQTSALGSRVGAIRMISRASLAASRLLGDPQTQVAGRPGYGGGGASGDSSAPRLSLFFDAAGGYGEKDPTDLEDAFDFEGYEYTLGLDYRFSDSLVAGALFGYTDRYVDFDSSQSIVDGTIDSKGYSLIAFLQWDRPWFYATASLGYQDLSFDIFRRISYPSFDANVPSTNTATAGSPDSSAFLGTLTVGVPFQVRAFGADVYLKADYQDLDVDAFTERAVAVPGNSGSGFQFNVGSQSIKSTDVAVGAKLQFVLTPRFGVFVPFIRGEYHTELEDQPRTISTVYAGLPPDVVAAVQDAVNFSLFSEKPDKNYYTLTGGVSAVLRGSTRVDEAGRAGGGLQAYLQYTTVLDLEHYDDSVIAGGLRYEF